MEYITEKEMKPIIERWRRACGMKHDIRKDDEVWVEFCMKVDHVTSGKKNEAQLFGFTEDGMCVSAPVSAVVERLARLGNGGEPIEEYNEDDPRREK
jgi:hypothetical protein